MSGEVRLADRWRSCRERGAAQAEAAHEVVGERMPEQDGLDLCLAAHRETHEAALAQMSIDAFSKPTQAVDRLAGLARHARPPRLDAGTVAVTGCIGLGAVLVLD